MSSQPIETAVSSPAVHTRRKQPAPTARRSPSAIKEIVKQPVAAVAEPDPRTTKQERVLTLLSRKGGASIAEIMAATNWQQHSVRGFFAGTVKKKLGFVLASSKKEGEGRRYQMIAGGR